MTTLNDQFTNFFKAPSEVLEPIRAANGVAAEAFERMTRQNYAVLGDYLNFAVEAARLPAKAADYNEYLAKQIEQTRAFGEQLVRRSQEYVELLGSFQAKAQAVAAAPVAKAKAA